MRAFNLFFEGFIKKQSVKQSFQRPSQGEYVDALITWANFTRKEKIQYVRRAVHMAEAEGLYFLKEFASKYKYIKLLNKQRRYKFAAQVQQKADRLLGATKLILVANPNGLEEALSKAPTGCKFSFANQVGRKNKRMMRDIMNFHRGKFY